MAKKKYYAYKIGNEEGILETWDECKRIVSGKNNAKSKVLNQKTKQKDGFRWGLIIL